MMLQVYISTQTAYLVIGILAVLFFTCVYLLVKYIKTDEKNEKTQSRFNELEHKINSMKLDHIDYKLNPHLFKNILNSIQSHAYQTYFALDKLANVLNYILYESPKRFVSPKEEIGFALNLIEINKIKISPLFELKVKTKLDESDPVYEQEVIAPMITIDLIENAFKHADLQSADAFITISFEFQDGCLKLTVANKVSAKPPMKKGKGGIGTETFEERLNIFYGGCYKLEQFTEDGVFISHLKIYLLEYKSKLLAARRRDAGSDLLEDAL